MAFDPDLYLKNTKAETRGFDPDAYLSSNLGSANQGTPIYGDLPSAVGGKPNIVGYKQQPVQPKNTMADYAKALYEVPATVVSGIAAPFIGVGAGVAENIREGTNTRVDRPELAQRFTYEPTSPVSQSILESVGQVLDTAKIAPVTGLNLTPTISQFGQYAPTMARSAVQTANPSVQRLASALRKEPTVEPTTGEIKSTIAQRYKEAFTPTEKPIYATAEELESASSKLFKQARDANILIDTKEFTDSMANLGKDLRQDGYTPTAYPKITAALDELTNASIPKDYTELRALRKIIQGAQKSTDGEEKRLATILKSEFDDYVLNIPESAITQGSKQGLKAWKEARDIYSRMSKAEVFEDMLDKAEITKGKFSQSGLENALFTELKNLAVNPKKMKLFTESEQKAIREAAEGTSGQNALRIIGKFAPTSTVSSILPLLLTGASAPLGLATTGIAIGARVGATQMRKKQLEQLANLMRGKVNPEWMAEPKPVNEQFLKMLRMDKENQ
jgi:hypothetical protein